MPCIEKVQIKKPCPRTDKVCKKPQCPECHGKSTVLVWVSKVYQTHLFDGRGKCIRCNTFKDPTQQTMLDVIGDFFENALVYKPCRTTEVIYAEDEDELKAIREELQRIKDWQEEIERKIFRGHFSEEEKVALLRRVEALEDLIQGSSASKGSAPVKDILEEVNGIKRKINWRRRS